MTTVIAQRREKATSTDLGPADVTITLLGRFAVTIDGGRLDDGEWRRRQAAALVKVLALAPSRTLHREQLIDMLWPELSVGEAAPRLHKAAHFARRAMGDPGSLVLAGNTVQLFPTRSVRVDATRFETLAAAAIAAADRRAASRAVDAYHGDLLPLDRYDDWAVETRDRLHLLYLDVLRLSRQWRALASADPTDEQAHLALIIEMRQRGDRRSALRQFEKLESALRSELGVEPSVAATRLRNEIARDAVTADRPSAGGANEAARSVSPTLIGRAGSEQALNAVLDTVDSGHGRAVFLSGPPGVGKTAVLSWLQHSATARGWRVGSGVAARVDGAWPYAPVLEAVADLCHRHPAVLDGLDHALRREIENGLAGREIAWTAHSGHQRLFVAAAELLRLAAAGSGAMLIIDDADHADDASLRLMHYLARVTISERAMIVFAHRRSVPDALAQVRQSLESRGSAVDHVLRPLNQAETACLVHRLSPASGSDFVDVVWTASGGLPSSVVELARDEGRLVDRRRFAFAAGLDRAADLGRYNSGGHRYDVRHRRIHRRERDVRGRGLRCA